MVVTKMLSIGVVSSFRHLGFVVPRLMMQQSRAQDCSSQATNRWLLFGWGHSREEKRWQQVRLQDHLRCFGTLFAPSHGM